MASTASFNTGQLLGAEPGAASRLNCAPRVVDAAKGCAAQAFPPAPAPAAAPPAGVALPPPARLPPPADQAQADASAFAEKVISEALTAAEAEEKPAAAAEGAAKTTSALLSDVKTDAELGLNRVLSSPTVEEKA